MLKLYSFYMPSKPRIKWGAEVLEYIGDDNTHRISGRYWVRLPRPQQMVLQINKNYELKMFII